MSSWEIILRVSQRQYSTLSTQSFYPLLAISRPSWLFQLSQKQLNFLIHLSPFSFFLKNVLATFFSFFLSPFSMILFKKWLSPYSYISHCFLFSDSANMQNFYSLFQYFLSYPYHPLSDFFKGREVTVGIDFSSTLSFWSCGFTSPPECLLLKSRMVRFRGLSLLLFFHELSVIFTLLASIF